MGTTIGATSLVLGTDHRQWDKGLDEAGGRFGKFTKGVEGRAQMLRATLASALDFGPILKGVGLVGGIGAAGAGILGGLSLAGLVSDSVKLAGDMESVSEQFRVMVGDAEKGEALFRDIESASDDIRVSMKAASDAARGFLVADIEGSQAVPTLRLLGELALGDEAKLGALSEAYTRARDAGVVNERTMRAFASAGVFLGDEMAKALGVGRAELTELLKDGQVGFPTLQRALVAITGEGGKFFGMMDRHAETFKGKVEGLENAWDDFKWKLGEVIIDEFGLKGLVDGFTKVVNMGEGGLDNLRPLFRDVANFAKDAGTDLLKGGIGLAESIASAKDMMGDIRASWADVKNQFVLPNSLGDTSIAAGKGLRNHGMVGAVHQMILGAVGELGRGGGGGGAMGPAEQAVHDFGKRVEDIFAKVGAMGEGQGGPMTDWLLKLGDSAHKGAKEIEALRIEAERLHADDLKKVGALRDEFDPVGKAGRDLDELRRIKQMGGFANDPGLFDFARNKIIGGLAGAQHDPARLSSLTVADSPEAVAAIIASKVAGMGGAKPDDPAVTRLEEIRKNGVAQLTALELLKDAMDAVRLAMPGVF